MSKKWIAYLGALLAFEGVCLAQTAPRSDALLAPVADEVEARRVIPVQANLQAPTSPTVDIASATTDGGFPQTWASVEYLLWRFSGAPVPAPLVTTSSSADGGILGKPSTQVLFGGDTYNAGLQSGFRLNVGRWIDEEKLLGIEATGFSFLPRRTTNFSHGTADSATILAVPFNNVTPAGGPGSVFPGSLGAVGAGENAFLISGGLFIPRLPLNLGAIAVTSSTEFWGAEANALFNLRRTNNSEVNFLLGFRYADLREYLNLDSTVSFPFLGPLRVATMHDHFGTRNQFYGGQFGLKGEWFNGPWFVNVVGKVALGNIHQIADVNGSFSDPEPVFFTTYGAGPTGGLLTQQSNIGAHNQNRFAVIPEVQLQIGANVTNRLRVFAGYDALYISNVVRPGNQIDRNINLTQSGATFLGQVPTLVGQASPAPQLNTSSFWAHGVTFGLQFSY